MNSKVQKYAYFACMGVWLSGVAAFLSGLFGLFGLGGNGEVVEPITAFGAKTVPMPPEPIQYMLPDPGLILLDAQRIVLILGIAVMIGSLVMAKHLHQPEETGSSVPDEMMIQ